MRRTNLLGLASRVVSGVGLLLVAGALPWLSRHDPAAAILRARYAELEPTEQALSAIREQLGLDQGPIAMSLQWWSAVLRGDPGQLVGERDRNRSRTLASCRGLGHADHVCGRCGAADGLRTDHSGSVAGAAR